MQIVYLLVKCFNQNMLIIFNKFPEKIFSFARVKKAKTGVVMTLFMDWATY